MHQVSSRRVLFEAVENFRDLGGYPSRLGGITRWGMVYRADRLDKMTDADIVRFDSLNIETVYDLRRDDERAEAPDRVESIQVCIMSALERGGHDAVERNGLSDHAAGELVLRDLYDGILRHAGPDIGRVLRGLSSSEQIPAVFHCTAGKDRTGVVAALLLEWLGVDRELILDDFELTNEFRTIQHQADAYEHLLGQGMSAEAAAGVLGAPRWAMMEMLADLDRKYGGIGSYLRYQCGLDDATLQALRDRLLDDI